MIIPWQVDVPQDRHPFVNWLIVAGIVAAFALQVSSVIEYRREHPRASTVQDRIMPGPAGQYVLQGWQIKGLFGYMWLHGGVMHLLGNLLFLWIFGNVVCAKIGNFKYLLVYIGLGFVAGVTHLMFSGMPVIGASGAINGIVGMFLILFPQNEITCYLVWFPYIREFTVSSYWMILVWFAFDLLGVFLGGGGVAYFAHVGGFLAGVATAIAMLKTKLVVMEPRYEKSLLDFYDEWRHPSQPKPDAVFSNFQRDIEYAKTLESRSPSSVILPLKVTDDFRTEERMIIMDDPPPDEFIRFACSCGQKVKIPAKFAGKVARCPACKKQIRIPGKS